MKYDTITKYLFIGTEKTSTRDPQWFFKRSSYALTGWITKTNKWIQSLQYHDCPKFIYEMEPDLEPGYKECFNLEYLSLFDKDSKTSKAKLNALHLKQLKKSYECINRGNVRVLETNRTVYFTGNSLNRLNECAAFIQTCFNSKMSDKKIGTSDVVSLTGDLIFTADYDPEENIFKKNWVNIL